MKKKDELKQVVDQAIAEQQVPHVKINQIGPNDVNIKKLTQPSKETHQEYWGKGLTYAAIGLIIVLVISIIGFIGVHGLSTFVSDHVNVFHF